MPSLTRNKVPQDSEPGCSRAAVAAEQGGQRGLTALITHIYSFNHRNETRTAPSDPHLLIQPEDWDPPQTGSEGVRSPCLHLQTPGYPSITQSKLREEAERSRKFFLLQVKMRIHSSGEISPFLIMSLQWIIAFIFVINCRQSCDHYSIINARTLITVPRGRHPGMDGRLCQSHHG